MMTIAAIVSAVFTTVHYQLELLTYIFTRKKYSKGSTLFKEDQWAQVQIFSLSLIFKMWHEPHYRCKSFQQDMKDNLRNVAVPGSGIPLSVFCYSYWVCLLYILIANPVVCLLGAINKAMKSIPSNDTEGFVETICSHYKNHLLHPDDWFSFWRLNCRLVSYHSLVTGAEGYLQEDKWTFLSHGRQIGVPVSPFIEDMSSLVCKHKSIEGGMGIYFYKNAVSGGDWILQERLENSQWLNDLLPGNAPLSTMRVITASSDFLREGSVSKSNTNAPISVKSKGGNNKKGKHSNIDSTDTQTAQQTSNEGGDLSCIEPLSAVLRLGRANANTDHSSILFNVDLSTGVIGEGSSNAHWYQLGLNKAYHTSWLPSVSKLVTHPDSPYPTVAGKVVPNMQEALKIVQSAHYKMMRDVPLVGWDVAFTSKGIFLLEVNLSCNFFRGNFDIPKYIAFVDAYWKKIEEVESSAPVSK